jgi:preprotein translocase subunit Sec63
MATLLALGRDKIYGFDPYGGDQLIFPVYFEGDGLERFVRHGTPIRVSRLNCRRVSTRSSFINGLWLMADFEPAGVTERELAHDPLRTSYETLGIHRKASYQAVKRAYRRLARKYHPDVNQTPEANQRMQQINDAYERIARTFEK